MKTIEREQKHKNELFPKILQGSKDISCDLVLLVLRVGSSGPSSATKEVGIVDLSRMRGHHCKDQLGYEGATRARDIRQLQPLLRPPALWEGPLGQSNCSDRSVGTHSRSNPGPTAAIRPNFDHHGRAKKRLFFVMK
jgi:hypothetical protein